MPVGNSDPQPSPSPAASPSCGPDWSKLRFRRWSRVCSGPDRVAPQTMSGASSGRRGVAAPRHARSFFQSDLVAVEETPDHGRREVFAAIGDRPPLDFQQRDIGLTANETREDSRDALRSDATVDSRPSANVAVAMKRQTSERRSLYHAKTFGRRIARHPSFTTASTTRLRRSSESAILAASFAASLKS